MSRPSIARSHRLCAFCPSLCRFSCPVEEAAARETASPRFLVGLGHHLTTGVLSWNGELAGALTMCDGCGACSEVCEHDVDVAGVLRAARAEAHRRDLSGEVAGRVAESLAAGLGPSGRFLDKPLAEVIGGTPEADTLVWPSDRGLERGPEGLRAFVTALGALGVDYRLPATEDYVPSARWAREIGARELARDLERRFGAAVAGAKRVVFEDPADRDLARPEAVEGLALWELEAPGGFRLEGEAAASLGTRRVDPSWAHLTGALGLTALTGAGDLRVSPGAAGLFDLLQPEVAEAVRARALERAGGRVVLLPTRYLADWWRQGGGAAADPSALRPRHPAAGA